MKALYEKHCEACQLGAPLVTEEEANELLFIASKLTIAMNTVRNTIMTDMMNTVTNMKCIYIYTTNILKYRRKHVKP